MRDTCDPMSALGQSLARRPSDVHPRPLLLVVPVGLLLAYAVLELLARFPPSPAIMVAGTLGLTGAVALTLLRYELAVAIGFLLLGIVLVEPAPTDGLFAIVMAVALVTGRFDLRKVPMTITLLLAAFIMLNLLSAIEAVDPARAGRFMLITLYLAAFALWLSGFVDSRRRARLAVRAYVAGAVATAAVTTAAVILHFPGSDALLAYGGTRGKGLFGDPNVYGPFLIPAALIVVEELLNPRLLRAGQAVKIAMFLALALGVLFSYSRAAWIALVASAIVLLIVLAMRRGGGRRAATVLGILIFASIAAAGILTVTDSLGFLEERAQGQAYDVDRFEAQRTGIDLAERNPVGVGPGQFETVVPISAHSTYVRTLAEQGILGFFSILGVFLATLIFAARNAVLGRDAFGIGSATLLATWMGLMINSLVIDTLHWRHLWVVAALIWVATTRPANTAEAPARAGNEATLARSRPSIYRA